MTTGQQVVRPYIPPIYVPTDEDERTVVDLHLHVKQSTMKRLLGVTEAFGLSAPEEFIERSLRELVVNDNSDATVVDLSTVSSLLDVWVRNSGLNLHAIETIGRPITEIENTRRGTIGLIVGAGPSVEKKQHLQMLATWLKAHPERRKDLTIVTTDRMLRALVEHGITPDFAVGIDGSEEIIKFWTPSNVQRALRRVECILMAHTNPKVVSLVTKKAKATYFMVGAIPQEVSPNTGFLLHSLFGNKLPSVACGGNVGTASWYLAGFAGCSTIGLIGLNLGFDVDDPLRKTPYWEALERQCKGDRTEMLRHYRSFNHQCWGADYQAVTDSVFSGYLRATLGAMAQNPQIQTYNCTEGGVLCASLSDEPLTNLTCMPFGTFLKDVVEPHQPTAPTTT